MICEPGFHVEEICVADPVVAKSWHDLGVVPAIAASPTAIGKQIVSLTPFAGRIYFGYGDWNDTKQPGCDLIFWNGSTFETITHVATDALWGNKVVAPASGYLELWALATDPEIGSDPDAVVVKPDGTFRVIKGSLTAYPWHLFDVIEFNGAVYLAGAYRTQVSHGEPSNASWATVWKRATDAKWSKPLVVKTAIRCYGLGIIGDTLYAFLSTGQVQKTTDGVTWTVAGVAGTGTVVDVTPFRNELLYLPYWPIYGSCPLYRFNGAKYALVLNQVSAFAVDADWLYVIVGPELRRTRDYVAWELVTGDVPLNVRSLCLLNGNIFIGTTDSRLWAHR